MNITKLFMCLISIMMLLVCLGCQNTRKLNEIVYLFPDKDRPRVTHTIAWRPTVADGPDIFVKLLFIRDKTRQSLGKPNWRLQYSIEANSSDIVRTTLTMSPESDAKFPIAKHPFSNAQILSWRVRYKDQETRLRLLYEIGADGKLHVGLQQGDRSWTDARADVFIDMESDVGETLDVQTFTQPKEILDGH